MSSKQGRLHAVAVKLLAKHCRNTAMIAKLEQMVNTAAVSYTHLTLPTKLEV